MKAADARQKTIAAPERPLGESAVVTGFTPAKLSFGRTASFPLRLGWLPKVAREIDRGLNFADDDAVVRLGVGKNMVGAIRFWAKAAGVIGEAGGKPFLTPDFGKFIFGVGGADQFMEDDATLWLLHWRLAANATAAAAHYLFFNRFHKAAFSEEEAVGDLAMLLRAEGAAFSEASLSRDIGTILRMYAPRGSVFAEENLDSPFPALDLAMFDGEEKVYRTEAAARDLPSPAILGFALAELFAATGASETPVRDLLCGDGPFAAPGSVFRLSEDGLLALLEKAEQIIPGDFALRESAGVWQILKTDEMRPGDYLRRCFGR